MLALVSLLASVSATSVFVQSHITSIGNDSVIASVYNASFCTQQFEGCMGDDLFGNYSFWKSTELEYPIIQVSNLTDFSDVIKCVEEQGIPEFLHYADEDTYLPDDATLMTNLGSWQGTSYKAAEPSTMQNSNTQLSKRTN